MDEETINLNKIKMQKSVDVLNANLAKIRTGRANPVILEHIKVDYHNTLVPINQTASINIEDAKNLIIQPWETTMLNVIYKAIMESDLGINPTVNGNQIRLPIPPLTEERRLYLSKQAKEHGEQAKVGIRNIRRDTNQLVKASLKNKILSEDKAKSLENQIQKLTNDFINQINFIVIEKEKKLLEI